MDAQIRCANWQDSGPILLQIRYAVFVDEQGVPAELERDDADTSALHLLAIAADGRPVGTGRLLPDGHIGRMAVLAAYRGQGIGTQLVQELLRLAGRRGLEQVFLDSQVQAIRFYERLGFQPEGAIFDDAGIPHRRMTMTIRPDRV